MLRIFTCFFGVLALALLSQAAQLGEEGTTIVVAGKGIVKVKPDVVHIGIGVEKIEESATEAQTAVIRIMNDVLASLRKMRIPKDKIGTTQVSLRAEYKYDKGKRTLIGYSARNQIKVTIDKLDDVGEIIDVSITAGATNINNVMFSIKDKAPYQKAALEKAFDDAKAKAEIIAKASDLVLIGIKRIQEVEAQLIPLVRGVQTFQARVRGAGEETPVLPGQLEVHGNLTVIFECKRK